MSEMNIINNEDKDRMLDLIGEVDEKYIEEAAPDSISVETDRKKLIKSSRLRIMSIAAGLVLILGVGLALSQSGIFSSKKLNDSNNEEVQSDDTRWPQKVVYVDEDERGESETGIVPKWDEMAISEQFSYFNFNSAEYSTRVYSIEKTNIGEKLGEVFLKGYDIYKDIEHTSQAEVYEIIGINKECALAICFENDTEYYVYVNSWYRPETLEEFISAISLDENVSFGKVYYNYFDYENEYHSIEFEDISDELVWNMLLSDTSLKNVHEDTHMHISEMSISVDVPLLGYDNISLSVTEDGYIVTNILNTGKCFYIGEDKVQAFVDYVLENCEGYEIVYVYESQDEGEAEEGMFEDSGKETIIEEYTSEAYIPE